MYVQRVDCWALSGSVVFLVNSEIFTYEYERPYINYLLFFLLRKKIQSLLQTAVKLSSMECDSSPFL
jgi:hypothetical protein